MDNDRCAISNVESEDIYVKLRGNHDESYRATIPILHLYNIHYVLWHLIQSLARFCDDSKSAAFDRTENGKDLH